MSKNLPVVGIACDVIKNGLHQFHGAGEKYINAVLDDFCRLNCCRIVDSNLNSIFFERFICDYLKNIA